MRQPRILITAGEASSDLHGAGLVHALRAGGLASEVTGVGGPAMAEAGVRLLADYDDLAVVGLLEVLGRVPRILRLLRRVRHALAADPPDLFIPIDAPDFNFRLLPAARRAGVPVVYFVAPQLWAWRAGRIRALRRHVRELLVLFPFEEAWFRERGVPTTYVGHPLVEEPGGPAAAAHPSPYVLLLPGSRRGEIGRHMPVLAGAVGRLRPRFPELRWVVRLAPGLADSDYAPWRQGSAIEFSRMPLAQLAAGARLTLAASGTASFEAALTATPLIVFYRLHPATAFLARRLVRVPWVAMANLASGRAIVPELLQGECTPERLATEAADLLQDDGRRRAMRAALEGLRGACGPPGAYARAAERLRAHLRGGDDGAV